MNLFPMLKYVSPNGKYIPERLLKHLTLFSECDLKVYLYLLSKTSLPGQKVNLPLDELAETLGFTRRSIKRSLSKWQGFGLLSIETLKANGRQKEVQLLVPSPSQERNGQSMSASSGISDSKGHKSPPENLPVNGNGSRSVDKSLIQSGTSEANVQGVSSKENNKAVINSPGKERESEGEKNHATGHEAQNNLTFEPKTKGDLLALDIAKAFHDEVHLPMYRHFCATMDESIIRRAFSRVMQTPEQEIKRSRPALFIYLIRKYAYPAKDQNPRP